MKRDEQFLREKREEFIQEHSEMVCRCQLATTLLGKDVDMFRQARSTQYGMQEVATTQTYLAYGI
jgi:hypothetical protein